MSSGPHVNCQQRCDRHFGPLNCASSSLRSLAHYLLYPACRRLAKLVLRPATALSCRFFTLSGRRSLRLVEREAEGNSHTLLQTCHQPLAFNGRQGKPFCGFLSPDIKVLPINALRDCLALGPILEPEVAVSPMFLGFMLVCSLD